MGSDNEELVRQGYEAFGKGDMETLSSLMKPDIVHSIPGNNQTSGEHKGIDEVLAVYGKIFELSGGTFKAELESLTPKGNTVAAVHHSTAERDGKKLEVRETLTFTIEDGKYARLDSSFSPEDQKAEDEFWA